MKPLIKPPFIDPLWRRLEGFDYPKNPQQVATSLCEIAGLCLTLDQATAEKGGSWGGSSQLLGG